MYSFVKNGVHFVGVRTFDIVPVRNGVAIVVTTIQYGFGQYYNSIAKLINIEILDFDGNDETFVDSQLSIVPIA